MKIQSPWITRARHERELALVRETSSQAIRNEYNRALSAGRAQVHAWARDSATRFFHIDSTRAKGAAIAAFQYAAQQFSPTPPETMTEALGAPGNVEEAINAAIGPDRPTAVGISAPGRDASGRGHIRSV